MKVILLAFAVTTLLISSICFLPAASSNASAAIDIFQNTCSDSSTNVSSSHVCNDVNSQAGNDTNPIIRIINAAIMVVSYIAGIAAVIGIVVSGLRLVLSGGDSNAAASARTGLVYSLVGIAVVALAQLIVVFILNRL